MSTQDPEFLAKRAEMIRKVSSILAKNKENGATEEEAASAIDMASKLMQKFAIEMHDLGEDYFRRTDVQRRLNLKYANKWRWELANAVSWNTGVYAVHYHGGRSTEYVMFYGQEHLVEGAALLAEYLVSTVEELSADFAKTDGSGLTGKRRFARGCSVRLRQRLQEAHNLAVDHRLPVIMAEEREKAKLESKVEARTKNSQAMDSSSREFLQGFKKGEHVPLQKTTQRITA